MEYELRKDIDRFKNFLDTLERKLLEKGITDLDLVALLDKYYDKSDVDVLVNRIVAGEIDLTDYVKKSEAEFDFSYSWGNPLLEEDSITIDIFLKEE